MEGAVDEWQNSKQSKKTAHQISLNKIDSFETCKNSNEAIEETSPEQCSINNKTFTADTPTENDEYIGMTEQEALDKAKKLGKIARVVERDGETQTVTMDIRSGRLNFTVDNGKVTKVDAEAVNIKSE